ncbi:Acyl-CoA dehydrogenase [Catalinimonas alkaloidigena]|uniref:Acyl-CoA dehydrogenase n=1 Tax=Catalinimonas alkaloidigena TaxID=1075417 RepID=A0A1G9TQB4_9BACT|nr:acyl-CoA dehydrogenase family protein [Catalinimonas alkaloidigena]SDM49738.1 Acyl-CoA dehydrogenase [Catalinimonas alkaloidigena]
MPLDKLLSKFRTLAEGIIAEEAPRVDQEARWPEKSMRLLQQERLTGLVVPQECGGWGQGLYALGQACEVIGQVSASTALCFGMHGVGAAVMAAKASPRQKKAFLEPIAQGLHLTTLALSEPGTGAHFYYPQTQLLAVSPDEFQLEGQKTFVTNGGHADSYVVSTVGVEPEAGFHQFSCAIVEKCAAGLDWGPAWNGIGMRGNSSRSLTLHQVTIPAWHLLGERGDQLWYIFQVVAPYFLTAMAGTYLGLAQAALDRVRHHLMQRHYSHSGLSLHQVPLLQHRLGTLWAKVERTRQLLYHAARQGDAQGAGAVMSLLAAKAEVAHCAVEVVNEAMTLAGGSAYREDSAFDVLLRDARAAHVMSPTTDLLYTWIGRALLDQPLLGD